MILRKLSECSTPTKTGERVEEIVGLVYHCMLFRVISADELMKVMISLGNPRTEAEIKVGEQWPL